MVGCDRRLRHQDGRVRCWRRSERDRRLLIAPPSRAESVFRSPAFTRFYFGQALSYLGYGLRLVAIPLLVYRLTRSANALGETYACELGSFALFGLVGGSLADRVDRRRLMIVCDAVRFAVLAGFALAFVAQVLSLPLLLVGIAVEGAAAGGFINAQSTSIRYVLGKDRATAAFAMLIGTEQLTTSILPPLGAALFSVTGPLPALAFNALTYLGSLAFIASVPSFGPDRGERPAATFRAGAFARTVGRDVRDGFTSLAGDDAMRSITALLFFFNFFGFTIAAVLIPFLKVDLGASDRAVGVAFGVGALGSVAGSLVAARVPAAWRLGRMITISYALDGLLFLPVVFTHDFWVAVIFLSLASGCTIFGITQIVGWRVRVTPEAMVGRVTSAARLVGLIGTVPGVLLGGFFADRLGARAIVAFGGYGYLAVAVALAFVPAIRRERR